MKLLALDTATDACSAALLVDARMHQRHELAPQRHTQLLLPMIQALCADAGVAADVFDAIAVSVGPGAFTGVRVATAIAQGLAYAQTCPVIAVSTLAALAQGGFRLCGTRHWLATLDARRRELYWAHYEIDETGIARARTPEHVGPAQGVTLPHQHGWRVVGTGWLAYAADMRGTWPEAGALPLLYPEAQDVAVLGAAALRAGAVIDPAHLAPTYLRAAL